MMKIIKIDNQKFAAFGDVRLPLREFLVNTIDDVESLNRDQWAGIIRDGGVEVPEGMEDQDLLHLAMSFAQNAWYHGTQGRISNNIHDKHAKRLERFKGLAAAVKARTPQVVTPRATKKTKRVKVPKRKPVQLQLFDIAPKKPVQLNFFEEL